MSTILLLVGLVSISILCYLVFFKKYYAFEKLVHYSHISEYCGHFGPFMWANAPEITETQPVDGAFAVRELVRTGMFSFWRVQNFCAATRKKWLYAKTAHSHYSIGRTTYGGGRMLKQPV